MPDMCPPPRAQPSVAPLALGLGLVVAILLLGKALTGLVDLPAPIEQMLGGDSDSACPAQRGAGPPRVDSTREDRPAARRRRPRQRRARPGHPLALALGRRARAQARAAAPPRASAAPAAASATPAPPRCRARNTPAPSTGETPVATSPAPSPAAARSPARARKMKLSVANVSSAGGSTASAGGARMRINAGRRPDRRRPRDRERGRDPGGRPPARPDRARPGRPRRRHAAQGPVVLSARLDVVDETAHRHRSADARAHAARRRRRTTSTAPTVVEAGDDGGLSNAVEVLIPVDSSQMFRRRPSPQPGRDAPAGSAGRRGAPAAGHRHRRPARPGDARRRCPTARSSSLPDSGTHDRRRRRPCRSPCSSRP